MSPSIGLLAINVKFSASVAEVLVIDDMGAVAEIGVMRLRPKIDRQRNGRSAS